jgi:multidrug efflux system outer membrane protein
MPGFGAGVPSELLLRRPDLAAAAARFDAAVSREGAARADFYPSVTLTGQAGWQADPASRIGQGAAGFWSLAPSVDLPVFDAGRRSANLEAARARIDGSAAEWTKAVLGAFREVEDALADLRELAQQEELTARVLAAVRVRLANAENRHKAGLASESELTLARRDEALAARTLSMVVWERRQVAVRLAAATGGGWSAK